jgi:hypothetical protein
VSYSLDELRQMVSATPTARAEGQWGSGDLLGLGLSIIVLFGATNLLTYKLGERYKPLQMAKSKNEILLDQSPPTGQTIVIAGKTYTAPLDSDMTASISPAKPAIRTVGSAYPNPQQQKLQNQVRFNHYHSTLAQPKKVQASEPSKTRLSQAQTTNSKGLSPIRPLPMPKPAGPEYWDKR